MNLLPVAADLLINVRHDSHVLMTNKLWKLRRICWSCFARWTAQDTCPTPGCRGPGSGFEPRRRHPPAPCVQCGTATTDRYLAGPVTVVSRGVFQVAAIPRCARCEGARTAAQQARLLAGGPA